MIYREGATSYNKSQYNPLQIMMDQMEQTVVLPQDSDLNISAYFSKVYSWMAAALVISAVTAWQTANSAALMEVVVGSNLFYGIIILELVLVVALAGWVQKMSRLTATLTFLAYSILTGLTLSTIFFAYTTASVAQVFMISAGMFGGLAFYGYTTKRDLSGWAGFLIMSLIGIIIASVINIWLNSHMIEWITTYAGIIVFAGLTAYDNQKLKSIGAMAHTHESFQKMAIYGALVLYLDFINLFLHLLRAFGDRR